MYTGERILPQKIFNVTFQQGIVAYKLVQQRAAGKTVLDVACGEGYGSALITERAAQVVGVDYDGSTIREAQKQYNKQNLVFKKGDIFNLQSAVDSQRFDVVCCFQTIEHFEDHDVFLKALTSVAKPGGIIIVTTPNRKIYPSFNPYHVHELDIEEITLLFQRHFPKFTVYGVFGDKAVHEYRTTKQRIGDKMLRLDFLKLRYRLPKKMIRFIYRFVSHDIIKRLSWLKHKQSVTTISEKNFSIDTKNTALALDFIVVAYLKPIT